MSLKKEYVTEPRIIAIKSWVQCDGCGIKMAEELEEKSYGYTQDQANEFKPQFELHSGWLEVRRGQYGNQTFAHACPNCSERPAGGLLGG